MTKTTWTYMVAGMEMEDMTAFGTAWQWAKEMARQTGDEIHRVEHRPGRPDRGQFYAKGCCFLNEDCYEPARAYHF